MRRLASIAALAVLGAALIVSLATSATETGGKVGAKDNNRQVTKIGGSDPGDSIVYQAKVSSQGQLSVRVENAPQDYVLLEPAVFSTRFVYGADGLTVPWTSPFAVTQDSTRAIETQGFSRLALLIRPVFTTGTQAALFALQVLAGPTASTDSSSMHAVLEHSISTTGKPDTLGSFTNYVATDMKAGANGPDTVFTWPGEKVLIIGPLPNSTNSVCVMLNNRDGTPITGPYIHLKLRLMNLFGATMLALGNSTNTYGTSVTSPENVKPITIRADLIGWR